MSKDMTFEDFIVRRTFLDSERKVGMETYPLVAVVHEPSQQWPDHFSMIQSHPGQPYEVERAS